MRTRVSAPLASVAFAAAVLAAGCGGQSSGSPASPASPTPTSTAAPTTTGGPYAYVQDVQPILASDCTRCHGGSKPSAGIDLSTYAGTMRVVSAGNANSTLVVVTGAGGPMNGYLSGDRAGKAEIIRQWVMSGAPEKR